MTKKKITAMIIVLWLFAVFAAVVFAVNYHLVFVPSLAACAITVAADVPIISILIIVAPEIISFGLLIFVSVTCITRLSSLTSLSMAYKEMLLIGRKL